ncbi:MAG: sulfurtransferase [Gemmatimonadetes bacterium 13_2_20CM_69_8]|nr:MAG: sulfurtransferase [Gemmatimonadetes bacterium 13_2_20CM_69_8]OLD93810.1 MAG: sulfurtransferase [Gemmatimonadetes bacterium 13_1_20CM_4_69_16]PYO13268.1 MAG: sulfurtransferase [Gemmatimonadota bacterium]
MPVGYAHPEALVSTDWVAQHLNDAAVRLIEVDVDTTAYGSGHVPGAVGWNWQSQLNDPVRRDIPGKKAFAALLSEAGVTPKTTVVLYGDNNNWFAAFAFWLLQLYGHATTKLMNGGRAKWVAEGRPLVTDRPNIRPTTYPVPGKVNTTLRAKRPDVEKALKGKTIGLVDVRSKPEFVGEIIAPPGMPETAQRAGHIPGAKNVPWSQAVAADGTFKPYEELVQLYKGAKVIDGKNEVIAYCRIGERSSHTWFALKYLLGVKKVKNYDGSWTEWGNLVGAPIVKGAE